MNYQALEQIAPPYLLFLIMVGICVGGSIVAIQALTLCVGFGSYAFRTTILLFRGKKQSVEKPLEADEEPRRKHSVLADLRNVILFFLLMGASVSLVIVCAHAGNEQNEKMAKNEVIATENIKAKYAVSEVDWHAGQTYARPFSTAPESIVVKDRSGQKIVFQYRMEPGTHEPFLTDLPKDSENPVESGTTTVVADSLLNK